MKRLLCLAYMLGTLALCAQEPPSGIVQVAVNYGPRQDAFFTGVVVGDGRMILTDGAAAARAREIAIAFSDGEILETVMAQIQFFNHIAVLPMAGHHGQIVSLAPLARDTAPQADVEAVAGGAPKAFQVDRRVVHLHPVGAGAALRWQITPAVPAEYRGGPLLSTQGQLIAMIVQEGETLVGMPLGEMLAMVEVAAAPAAPIPLTRPAAKPPAEPEVKPAAAEPVRMAKTTPPADEKPAIRQPTPSAPPAVETKIAENKPPAITPEKSDKAVKTPPAAPSAAPPAARPDTPPTEDALSSVFKDSAIGALHMEVPVVPKASAPKTSVPPVVAVNLPLRPIRSAWVWKAAVPPPPEAATVKVAQAAPPEPSKTAQPPGEDAKPTASATPRDLQELVAAASDFMQKKEYPKAVDALEAALQQHPEAVTLHFQLALAYWYKALQKPDGSPRSSMEKTAYHKAIKSFETFLEKAPNDPLAAAARMRLTVLRNAQFGGG
jgi:hypothetical protein